MSHMRHMRNEAHLARRCSQDAKRMVRVISEWLDRHEAMTREQAVSIRDELKLISRDLETIERAVTRPIGSDDITQLRASIRARGSR